jgi:hypothetical protein
MSESPAADKHFRYLLNHNRGLSAGDNSRFFQSILEGQGIEYRGQHSGIIGGHPVHAAAGDVCPTPEITASNYYSHGDSCLRHILNLFSDMFQDSRVYTGVSFTREGFTAQFE